MFPATTTKGKAMSKNTSAPDITTNLLQHAEGDHAAEELVFDPQTGTLMVLENGQALSPDSDAVPATVMAREGFFAR